MDPTTLTLISLDVFARCEGIRSQGVVRDEAGPGGMGGKTVTGHLAPIWVCVIS